MGDVLTLIEKAQETVDEKEAEKLAKKMKANAFDMNDLLDQMQQIKKMGLDALDHFDAPGRRGQGHR